MHNEKVGPRRKISLTQIRVVIVGDYFDVNFTRGQGQRYAAHRDPKCRCCAGETDISHGASAPRGGVRTQTQLHLRHESVRQQHQQRSAPCESSLQCLRSRVAAAASADFPRAEVRVPVIVSEAAQRFRPEIRQAGRRAFFWLVIKFQAFQRQNKTAYPKTNQRPPDVRSTCRGGNHSD